MKCPKCGYTSFDYLESCKKCNNALGEFKTKYGLRSLLFPHRTQKPAAAVTPTLAAATATPALVAATETSDSTDFGYDFGADAPIAAPLPAPATPAVDDFDFDSDWNAPAEPLASTVTPAEDADDSFDFMADSPEPGPGFSALGDELDLGAEPTPLAGAEETAFEFDDGWGESTLEQAPATVASPSEEALPEFAAETFDFTEDGAATALSFSDEFDFTDDETPDLLAGSEEATANAKQLGAKEGPSDPFDQRESAPAGSAPVESSPAEATLDEQPETSASLDSGADASPAEDLGETAAAPELVETARFLTKHPESGQSTVEAATAVDDPVDQGEDEAPLELDEIELAENSTLASLKPTGAPFFRIGAGAFDLLLLALIYALFLAAGKFALFPADQAMSPIPLESLLDLAIPYFLILFALCFGYFTLFHFLSGQTPGKMIFRLKVESASGAPIDFAQAFLRSVGGLISLLCAGIGFLFILRAPEHRGWNDHLAGTRVIDTTLPLTELD